MRHWWRQPSALTATAGCTSGWIDGDLLLSSALHLRPAADPKELPSMASSCPASDMMLNQLMKLFVICGTLSIALAASFGTLWKRHQVTPPSHVSFVQHLIEYRSSR
mmetsp:Transcript_125710/g.350221  ORF Transcript_125710/g.350221 Transcript_125710/m.350221 type:complete len:107 (-) Transcript_125710:11-331(-)